MFTPFAVEAPIFGLYKLFKAEAEAIGWEYHRGFSTFSKYDYKAENYQGLWFADKFNEKEIAAFALSSGWNDENDTVFRLPEQWNEALAHCRQQFNALNGIPEPLSNFEPFNDPSDLVPGDTVRFKSGGGVPWLVESVNMDVALLVATRTLYNAVEWERLKRPAPATAWQPIETAPKDGTWILRQLSSSLRLPETEYKLVRYLDKGNEGSTEYPWFSRVGYRYKEDAFFPKWAPLPK